MLTLGIYSTEGTKNNNNVHRGRVLDTIPCAMILPEQLIGANQIGEQIGVNRCAGFSYSFNGFS